MYWQDLRLVDARSLTGTSGTETVDLPESGLLSSMEIRFDAKASETDVSMMVGPVDALTKIEVVHMGTQVVKSFNGRVARGIGFLDDGKIMPQKKATELSETQWAYVPINFGTRFKDTEYALDLSKLTDPKLKVQWDCTLTDPVTGYGFHSTPVATLSVITHTIREPIVTPKGFIKSSQVKEYTLTQDSIEDVKFPLGNPFRRIMVRAYDYDTTNGVYWNYIPSDLLELIVLDINDGEIKPVQLRREDFINSYLREYGLCTYGEPACFSVAHYIDRHLGYVWSMQAEGGSTANIINCAGAKGPWCAVYVHDHAGNADDLDQFRSWMATGVLFESLIPIGLDRDGMENLLVTRDLSSVKLHLTAYSTITYTSKAEVYLEELVTQ